MRAKPLRVIAPGARVTVATGIDGRVTAVTVNGIPPKAAGYTVSRFVNGEHREEFFEAWEVNQAAEGPWLKIGF